METKRFEINYSPTPEDYVTCLRDFSYRDRRTWILLSGWLVVTLIIIFFYLRGTFGTGLVTGVVVFLFPLLFLFSLFSGPGRVGRQVKKNPIYTSEVRMRVDDKGIFISHREENVELPWETFARAREISDHFLLFRKSDPRQFQFIPKRAFESPEQEEAFRQLLQEHLL